MLNRAKLEIIFVSDTHADEKKQQLKYVFIQRGRISLEQSQ